MGHDHSHGHVLAAALRQVQNIMESSKQPMYLFVDEDNKACNGLFAEMMGYKDPASWAAVKKPFASTFVDSESQDDLIGMYQDAMEHGVGGVASIVWKRKDGDAVDSDVILVPLEAEAHRFALHFIQPVDEGES